MKPLPKAIKTKHVLILVKLGGRTRLPKVKIERLDYIAAYNGAEVAQQVICKAIREQLSKANHINFGYIRWESVVIERVEADPSELSHPSLF